MDAPNARSAISRGVERDCRRCADFRVAKSRARRSQAPTSAVDAILDRYAELLAGATPEQTRALLSLLWWDLREAA